MSDTKYTVDYFIAKFTAIPDEKWCVEKYESKSGERCALGHCGRRPLKGSEEAKALGELFWDRENGLEVPSVNDGRDDRFPQPTPKARILAALEFIKTKQAVLSADEQFIWAGNSRDGMMKGGE